MLGRTLRSLTGRSLPVRRGAVVDTYPGLGVGNYLYLALYAATQRRAGRPTWVQDTGLDPAWREALPRLVPLLAGPSEARWRRRTHLPSTFFQAFGTDFTAVDLAVFVQEVILPTLPLPADPTPDLVVNVRRGDYYDNPDFRALYGFDVPAYVRAAVGQATAGGSVSWLSVVSDDPAWCAEHLAWLAEHADRVTFGAQGVGQVGDFVEVAMARTLVLSNSTFSYWAAYTSQALHGVDHGGVWAPYFHQRNVDDGRPWQHDPRWHTLPISPLGS